MGLLSRLFGPKPAPSHDRVFIDATAKRAGLIRALHDAEAPALIIYHFADSRPEVERLLDEVGFTHEALTTCDAMADAVAEVMLLDATLLPERPIPGGAKAPGPILLLERHPLRARDERAGWLCPKGGAVLSFLALDEPLLGAFGVDRIQGMLGQLGLDPSEPIEHVFVSKAIANAQRKLEGKALSAHDAPNVAAWLERNMPMGWDR